MSPAQATAPHSHLEAASLPPGAARCPARTLRLAHWQPPQRAGAQEAPGQRVGRWELPLPAFAPWAGGSETRCTCPWWPPGGASRGSSPCFPDALNLAFHFNRLQLLPGARCAHKPSPGSASEPAQASRAGGFGVRSAGSEDPTAGGTAPSVGARRHLLCNWNGSSWDVRITGQLNAGRCKYD